MLKIIELKKETIIYYALQNSLQENDGLLILNQFDTVVGGFQWDASSNVLEPQIMFEFQKKSLFGLNRYLRLEKQVSEEEDEKFLKEITEELNNKIIENEKKIVEDILKKASDNDQKYITTRMLLYYDKDKRFHKLFNLDNNNLSFEDINVLKKLNCQTNNFSETFRLRICDYPENLFKEILLNLAENAESITFELLNLYLPKKEMNDFYLKKLIEEGYSIAYRDKNTNTYVHSEDFTFNKDHNIDSSNILLLKTNKQYKQCQEIDLTTEN